MPASSFPFKTQSILLKIKLLKNKCGTIWCQAIIIYINLFF